MFNPTAFKTTYKHPTMCAASFGPGEWVTHELLNPQDVPIGTHILLYRVQDQKSIPNTQGNPSTYVYHMHKGVKHGVEYITRDTPNGVQKAKAWTCRSMALAFAHLLKEKATIVEEYYHQDQESIVVRVVLQDAYTNEDECEVPAIVLDIRVVFYAESAMCDFTDNPITFEYDIHYDGDEPEFGVCDYYPTTARHPNSQDKFTAAIKQVASNPEHYVRML